MADVKDIILGEGYDLMIQAGDFKSDFSDDQHISLLLLTNKGGWRQSPLTGIGIITYLNTPVGPLELDSLKQAIKIQLQLDGYNPNPEIKINSLDDITINATR